MSGTDSVIDYDAWKVEKIGAHAFVQWKGTDACLGFHCPCGGRGHIDGDFLYTVRCLGCGTVYETEPYVRLLKATPERAADDEKNDRIHNFGDKQNGNHWEGWPVVLKYLAEAYERDKGEMDAERRDLLWKFLRRNGGQRE